MGRDKPRNLHGSHGPASVTLVRKRASVNRDYHNYLVRARFASGLDSRDQDEPSCQ